MKDFDKIIKMKQDELKKFLKGYLEENSYEVVDRDGFLYAKGTAPVLLVAHMDRYPESKKKKGATVEDRYPEPAERVVEIKKNIVNGETRWSSPQGICGDDRCGIWSIMQLIKKHHASVLFTEDEEIGCVGAKKFCWTEYVHKLGVNYMVQIDRREANDAVFYECGNADFKKFITQTTKYVEQGGNSTDIRYIMAISDIAGVNFSCGYHKEHSAKEYVVIEEMQRTLNTIDSLLDEKVNAVYAACVSPDDYDKVRRGLEEYKPQE